MLHASEYTLAGQGLQNAKLVLIGAGDPVAMLNQAAECKTLGIPFALDPSWQVARFSGEEMSTHFQGATYLFCNDYESAIIQSKTGWSLEELQTKVAILVVTHSERGSMIYTDYGRGPVYEIPSAKLEQVINPTGAGDAYRGGFFAAHRVGLPLDICGRVGALSAVYSLEHAGPIDHHFTVAEFRARYETNFGPEARLAWLNN